MKVEEAQGEQLGVDNPSMETSMLDTSMADANIVSAMSVKQEETNEVISVDDEDEEEDDALSEIGAVKDEERDLDEDGDV